MTEKTSATVAVTDDSFSDDVLSSSCLLYTSDAADE